jgi:glycine hydroxymethyltransferase
LTFDFLVILVINYYKKLFMKYENLKKQDVEVYNLSEKERERKEGNLDMIPSENYASKAVLEALSSCFNDKYAEGYPGARYYGGNQYVDELEILCQERAKKLFNVPFVNVQGYSGSPANHAVYMATLSVGDKVMGMDLRAGGHLTHGWKVNFSGKYYNSVFYGINKETELLDYEEVRRVAEKEKPKLIFMGATSYSRKIDFKYFKEVADDVGAYLCADISHISGLVVSGAHESPVPYADIVTTTTHKTLRGPRGALIMVTEEGLKKDKDLGEKINKAVFPGLQGGPHEHQVAAIAVCLKEAGSESFSEYGKQVVKNCKVLAEELKQKGFRIVFNGTENHLLLIDLTSKGISGKEGQEILERAGIIVNKNAIPFDVNPPANPSGVRMGTPALTTRGMKEEEMKQVATIITEVLTNKDEETTKKAKETVKNLCSKFPIY